MRWNRALLLRVIPFAAFMLLLALRGAAPDDGSWGFDPQWIYGAAVLVVGALLAAFWRASSPYSRQKAASRAPTTSTAAP